LLLLLQPHAPARSEFISKTLLVVCCFAAAADVKKAKEGGFYTIQSLIMNPRKVSGCRAALCSQHNQLQLPAYD
jgi:hypothetical protein